MTEKLSREDLQRQYENGGLSYADYARLLNERAIEEYVPERTEPMPEDTRGADIAATQPGKQYTLSE